MSTRLALGRRAWAWAFLVGCGAEVTSAGGEDAPCNDTLVCATGLICDGGVCARLCNGDDGCDAARQHCEAGLCRPGSIINCGDGAVQATEGCDDAGRLGTDGCNGYCQLEPGWTCVGEPSLCTSLCGNGAQDPQELCDDGNPEGGDGCSIACTVEAGFECSGFPSVCVEVCPSCPAGCGDGLVANDETCDDGGLDSGDGCDSTCHEEDGWDCAGSPSFCICEATHQVVGSECLSHCDAVGWSCSGQGACDSTPSGPECACNSGFQDNDGNGTCLPDCGSLACVDGVCDDESGVAVCVCNDFAVGALCDDCRVYVDAGATGTADGEDWPTAFLGIEAGIDRAIALRANQGGCEVWVASGTFYIWQGGLFNDIDIGNDVRLYGSFPVGADSLDDRQFTAAPTILDGTDPDNSSNRVHHIMNLTAGTGSIAVRVDGFTFVGGGNSNDGGAIYANHPSRQGRLTVVNSTFSGNRGGNGAAIFAVNVDVLEILSSKFVDNAASLAGGALTVRATDPGASVLSVDRCELMRNTAVAGGGAIDIVANPNAGTVSVRQSVFANNQASANDAEGGAMKVAGPVPFEIDGVAFLANTVAGNNAFGGALVVEALPSTGTINGVVRDTSFIGNYSGDSSAAFRIHGPDGGGTLVVSLINTLLIGNAALVGAAMRSAGDNSRFEVWHLTAAHNVHPVTLWSTNGPDINIRNSILRHSTTVTGNVGTGIVDVSYSNISAPTPVGTGNIDDGGCFAAPSPATGVWSATPSYSAATGQTTFTASVDLPAGAGPGIFLNPDTAQGRFFRVEAASARTLAVFGDLAAVVQSGDSFELYDATLAAGSACVDSGIDNGVVAADRNGVAHRQTIFPATNADGAPSYPDMGAHER